MDFYLSELNLNSVEDLPGLSARAAFTVNSQSVFKEDVDIVPTIFDDSLSYMPWGGDNQIPYEGFVTTQNGKKITRATYTCELRTFHVAVQLRRVFL